MNPDDTHYTIPLRFRSVCFARRLLSPKAINYGATTSLTRHPTFHDVDPPYWIAMNGSRFVLGSAVPNFLLIIQTKRKCDIRVRSENQDKREREWPGYHSFQKIQKCIFLTTSEMSVSHLLLRSRFETYVLSKAIIMLLIYSFPLIMPHHFLRCCNFGNSVVVSSVVRYQQSW